MLKNSRKQFSRELKKKLEILENSLIEKNYKKKY